LRTLNANAKLRVSEALNSSYVAIESLNKYRQALRVALDETKNEDNKELQWRQVTDLFDMQTADVNEAKQKFQIAKYIHIYMNNFKWIFIYSSFSRNTLGDLDTMVREIKSVEFSKNVKNLREAQLDAVNQYRLLQAEQAKVNNY
jgi:hypothetical protein